MLITLRQNLSNNENVKNAIFGGYFETNADQIDLTIMFLSLFNLCKCFSDLFHIVKDTIVIYKKLAWNLLEWCKSNFPPFIKFYIQNI